MDDAQQAPRLALRSRACWFAAGTLLAYALAVGYSGWQAGSYAVRPLALAAIALLIGALACAAAAHCWSRGDGNDCTSETFRPVKRARRELLMVCALASFFMGTCLSLPTVTAARLLAAPTSTVAVAVHHAASCFRCPDPVHATYRTRSGFQTDVTLAASDWFSSQRAGMRIRYDLRDPRHAMNADDFADGTSTQFSILVVSSLVALPLFLWWFARSSRRWRERVGKGRPGVGLTSVSQVERPGGRVWRTTFADDEVVDYEDRPGVHQALSNRLAADLEQLAPSAGADRGLSNHAG